MRAIRTAFANLDINDPLVAWLVYRASLVSSTHAHAQALSFWLTQELKREAQSGRRSFQFEDEIVLEALRLSEYPDVVSRVRGLFLFDDQQSSDRAIQRWGGPFQPENVAEVGILEGSRWSRHDADWVSKGLGRDDRSWMRPYLRGDPLGDEPVWELIVDGRAITFGTELREEAYEVIKSWWPRSTALLELSRVAVELASDLGLILPAVLGSGEDRRVDYIMNFADATNDAFLDRFAAYDGPKNLADLNENSESVVPDLRRRGFALPEASRPGGPPRTG